MTKELEVLFKRTKEIKGDNFKIGDVHTLLQECMNLAPTYLAERYVELQKELYEHCKEVFYIILDQELEEIINN
jgi:hypothetical protein